MINEFKKFVLRGNVLDLAVGIVIGTAFTGIVNSLVNNVIMPFVGVLTAGVNFKDIRIDLTALSRILGNDSIPEEGIYMSVGIFINSIVEFFIIAMTIFFVIKIINKTRERIERVKKQEEKEIEESKPDKPEDIRLLEEIRNLLKKQNKIKEKK